MTAIGGLGHTLPYLIPEFWTATWIAVVIVFIELWAISWIRYKYMDTPFLKAAFQIAVGGFLVFLTGILIGIGETRDERVDALEAIRDLHATHGHIQEIIIQNFRAKPDTKLADSGEPDLDDLLWTIATARLVLGPDMNIQAPPNLSPGVYQKLIDAGLNDWGGISPVTPDHVNPEAPWPEIARLEQVCASAGRPLVERLTIYPRYIAAEGWLDAAVRPQVLKLADSERLGRDTAWSPGLADASPGTPGAPLGRGPVRR